MDTITLQEALAGFTANESAALGSYIGLSSGGVGQKQSIAALAKVAGEQIGAYLQIDLSASTNLNYYTGNASSGLFGFAYISNITQYTNIPNGVSYSAIFEVLGNPLRVIQRLTLISNKSVYIRFYNGTTWSAWFGVSLTLAG